MAQPSSAQNIEQVLIGGDLSKLTAAERLSYYNRVCESLGLNPLTRPFDYINLSGKLTLYAKKDCTEQLRTIHKVSVDEAKHEYSQPLGLYTVTVKGHNGEGRSDTATGAVSVEGLKGDNLANAVMKSETKAKRRFTLSICGLGMLDETEIESIPEGAVRAEAEAAAEPPKPWAQELVDKAKANGKSGKDIRAFLNSLQINALSKVPVEKQPQLTAWAEGK
jgi:hypothetical protein